MSKRRKKQLKARKPFQTIFLRKTEKRWGNRTVAKEGHTISEASFDAARRRRSFGTLPSNPVINSPRLEAILKAHFGLPEPPDQYIVVNRQLRLYFTPQRTHYRFVEIAEGKIKTSIRYTSVAIAMMSVNRIVWVQIEDHQPAVIL